MIGVSALIAASPVAFATLKFAGGAYLLWLGVQALRGAGGGASAGRDAVAGSSLRDLFLRGVIANAVNPKVVLFFLAFLPQFVVPTQGRVGLQLGVLGLVFTAQAAVIFASIGYFAGTVGAWLQQRPRASAWMDRIAGTVFVGLGLRLVVAR